MTAKILLVEKVGYMLILMKVMWYNVSVDYLFSSQIIKHYKPYFRETKNR